VRLLVRPHLAKHGTRVVPQLAACQRRALEVQSQQLGRDQEAQIGEVGVGDRCGRGGAGECRQPGRRYEQRAAANSPATQQTCSRELSRHDPLASLNADALPMRFARI